jgi:hypothetical protein
VRWWWVTELGLLGGDTAFETIFTGFAKYTFPARSFCSRRGNECSRVRLVGYWDNPIKAIIAITVSPNTTPTVVPLQSGLTYTSPSGYGYIIGYVGGSYTVNGSPMYPYSSSTTGDPASYALMTSPKIFTKGNNFYTFDQDSYGGYVSVTGNGQTYPVNPYQFSINGVVSHSLANRTFSRLGAATLAV